MQAASQIIFTIAGILTLALTVLLAYRSVYVLIGAFRTRVFPRAGRLHRYGIVIAARNEEAVIGQLLDSIREQDYPLDLIRIFVVADNCTDATAAIARQHGAICYERTDPAHRTKGYALEYLFDCLARDGWDRDLEGYFVLDADNLLCRDYLSRMNDAFDAGEKIVTSFRNTKNFKDNAISFSYGIHWMNTARCEHRARSFLGLSTRLQGTGYLFDASLLQKARPGTKPGWHYTSLTEDRELTADAVCLGWRVSYQDAAQFYDEQPTSLRVAMRQRLRWSRGHWEIFLRTAPVFLREMIRRLFLKREKQAAPEDFRRLRDTFICYDIFATLLPEALVSALAKLLKYSMLLLLLITGYTEDPALSTLFLPLARGVALWYLGRLVIPCYILWAERRRIPSLPVGKCLIGAVLWPLFPLIGDLTMLLAVFRRVEWKPIPHRSAARIEDLEATAQKVRPGKRWVAARSRRAWRSVSLPVASQPSEPS